MAVCCGDGRCCGFLHIRTLESQYKQGRQGGWRVVSSHINWLWRVEYVCNVTGRCMRTTIGQGVLCGVMCNDTSWCNSMIAQLHLADSQSNQCLELRTASDALEQNRVRQAGTKWAVLSTPPKKGVYISCIVSNTVPGSCTNHSMHLAISLCTLLLLQVSRTAEHRRSIEQPIGTVYTHTARSHTGPLEELTELCVQGLVSA